LQSALFRMWRAVARERTIDAAPPLVTSRRPVDQAGPPPRR
jgi:hypothetical protein